MILKQVQSDIIETNLTYTELFSNLEESQISTNRKDSINFNDSKESKDLKSNFVVLEERNVVTAVKGGKTRRKRVTCIATDLKNSMGLGIGKDGNSLFAIYKAKYQAFNNLIGILITVNKSIPHLINAKFGAANILIFPACFGTGIIAPYFLKTFLYCCGVNNIITKQFGSSNILNNSIALVKALKLQNRLYWHAKFRLKSSNTFYKKILK